MIIDNNVKMYTNKQLISKGFKYSLYSLSVTDWYVADTVDELIKKAKKMGITTGGIYEIKTHDFIFLGDLSEFIEQY